MGTGSWGGTDMPCFPQPSISSVVTAPFPDDSQVLLPSASLSTVIHLMSPSCIINVCLSNHTKSSLPKLPRLNTSATPIFPHLFCF